MYPRRKLGRPVGSRTFRETPAVKRAREYHALRLDGMKPSKAARIVAVKWMVSESTIYSDSRRHISRLVADLERQSDDSRIRLLSMLLHEAIYKVDHQLDAREVLTKIGRLFMQGTNYRISNKLDALGAHAQAQWVREIDREMIHGNEKLESIGRQLIEFVLH